MTSEANGPTIRWGASDGLVDEFRDTFASQIVRFTEQRGECVIWTGATTSNGYGTAYAPRAGGGRGGKRRYIMAHRLAWILANGPIPYGLGVCHTCDTPRCCRIEHLFLGTQRDNIADMVAKGRNANHARLVADDILADARARWDQGVPTAIIAAGMGVSENVVVKRLSGASGPLPHRSRRPPTGPRDPRRDPAPGDVVSKSGVPTRTVLNSDSVNVIYSVDGQERRCYHHEWRAWARRATVDHAAALSIIEAHVASRSPA